jgi:hypothetical protein
MFCGTAVQHGLCVRADGFLGRGTAHDKSGCQLTICNAGGKQEQAEAQHTSSEILPKVWDMSEGKRDYYHIVGGKP